MKVSFSLPVVLQKAPAKGGDEAVAGGFANTLMGLANREGPSLRSHGEKPEETRKFAPFAQPPFTEAPFGKRASEVPETTTGDDRSPEEEAEADIVPATTAPMEPLPGKIAAEAEPQVEAPARNGVAPSRDEGIRFVPLAPSGAAVKDAPHAADLKLVVEPAANRASGPGAAAGAEIVKPDVRRPEPKADTGATASATRSTEPSRPLSTAEEILLKPERTGERATTSGNVADGDRRGNAGNPDIRQQAKTQNRGDDGPRGAMSAPGGDTIGARVSVLNVTNSPAPAPFPNVTISGLVAAIEAEPTWRIAPQDPASGGAMRAQTVPAGTSTLRIQLNPAELGMVTARLTASGSQLSIEIQVESNDARQRLSNDSDAIVNALRGIGIDVDKVTIHQASAHNAASQQQGLGREPHLADQGGQRDQDARRPGRDGTGQNGERGHGSSEAAGDRPRSGVYI